MTARRPISRRSFLRRVGGTMALGSGASALGGCVGIADSDPYDPIGHGGYGRHYPPPEECTDSDTGRYSDPPGRGRCGPPAGCTDSDDGRYRDPPGQGRCR
jgi:hypothetical protein